MNELCLSMKDKQKEERETGRRKVRRGNRGMIQGVDVERKLYMENEENKRKQKIRLKRDKDEKEESMDSRGELLKENL